MKLDIVNLFTQNQPMNDVRWVRIDTVSGDVYAELIRGLLEANAIPVILSQEGAGRSVYHVSVGPLSEVEILVPTEFLEQARNLIDAFFSGNLEIQDDEVDQNTDDLNQTD